MDTADLLDIDVLRATGALPHFFGLGFVQLKLNDSERMHFYHPDAPCITGTEEVHNHRYDFVSHVLLGTLKQTLYSFEEGRDREGPDGRRGDYSLNYVTCRPDAVEKSWLVTHGDLTPILSAWFAAGSRYEIKSDVFHTVEAERAITFLQRGSVVQDLASVIRPRDAIAICPFSAPKPEAECWEIIRDLLTSAETDHVGEERAELRLRMSKALTNEPANDYIRGYRSAFAEMQAVMNQQEAARAWSNRRG